MATNKGGAEVTYIVLSVLIIISVISAGLPIINSLTTESKEDIEEPDFELVSTQPILIEYSAERSISGTRTQKLYLTNLSTFNGGDKDDWIEVYPSTKTRNTTRNSGFDEGTVIFNSSYESQVMNNQDQIRYGDTVVGVWKNTDNQVKVVSEFFVPSTTITGTSVTKNYSVGGCIDDNNCNV